jgi:ATPase subunit of ABC transporter with duplicated ATPase domains
MNGIIEDLKFKYGEKRWREFSPAQKKKEIAYQRSLIREGREYSAEKKKAQKTQQRASNILKRERKQKQEADKLKRVFFASRNSPLLQNIFPGTGGEN